jgi:hypothetical protein
MQASHRTGAGHRRRNDRRSRRTLVRTALLLTSACLACESAPTPTETIVVVDAERSVRALVTNLHARVQGDDGIVRFEAEFEPHWPVRLAVIPLGGDAKREFELTLGAQREDGTTLVETRVHTGFVADAKRYHRVLLSEDCLGLACGPNSTCRKGSCVSAHVATRALVASACSGRSCRPSSGAEEGGDPDAAADGGPNDAEAAANCGDMQLACKGVCVARDSLEHCGACDRDCRQLQNVEGPTRCDTDRCAFEPAACSPGYGDCNGDPDDGCEIELNEPENCGACGATCEEPQLCAATGSGHGCVAHCPVEGQAACDGSCVDLTNHPKHCGVCGAACEQSARCEAGRCGEPCIEGAACTVSECRDGETRCQESGQVCEATEPVLDGTACGAAGSCRQGQCTCGISDGRLATFYGCASEADCLPGNVCSDLDGNGTFVCRALCESTADCEQYHGLYPELRCAAALCPDGSDPGVRVCVERDGKLAPAYQSSPCCGGPGSEGVSVDGCSDGTREAFTDLATFPSIAGCEAKWPVRSMRDPATGSACGNSLGVDCSVPADACATGWHVCGTPPYGPVDIASKLTAEECSTQPGRFAMALADQMCEPCVEAPGQGAACCGVECVTSYASCVFPNQTLWFGWDSGRTNQCAAALSTSDGQGVMCCRGY